MTTSTPAARPQSVAVDADRYDVDAVIVGAGPAGSSAAYWLATAGLSVALVEKSQFPREKVCGDGLTPRGTRALIELGIDVSEEAGWLHNKGLRVLGGGLRLELDWPELASFPNYGLVRPRADLDALLATQAVKAGAVLHQLTTVGEPILDVAGRVVGVQATTGPDKRPVSYHAPVVLSADGVSGKLAQRLGLHRNEKRPMGVAVRRYYTSPRTHDDYLESWLELWDGPPGADDAKLLPGYGWVFGMGDGTVNVGLGVLNTSAAFQKTDYRALLTRWLDNTPEEWGLREENATCPTRGAGLPMGFNRGPHYARGLFLVGDTGGSVNPFNGEGIPYAIESGKFAAEAVIQGLARTAGPQRELAFSTYPKRLQQEWGAYYRLGGIFVKLIGHPEVMRACTRHGLPHPGLMRLVLKLLANLTDPHDGDAADRIITALTRITPAVR
jgi:geranylgeranyl reductase family protein